jgi:hypothetical protein
MSNISIVSAEYLEEHKIRIVFSDGLVRVLDFKPFLERFAHPEYDCYLNENNFKNFEIVDGNICWDDYHMIFTIDSLYKGII